MKRIAAILALLYSVNTAPEQPKWEWWQEGVLGAPCSLKTDIEEGTCTMNIKDKPDWARK